MSDAKQNASPYYTKGRVLKSAIAELIDDYEALKREANELREHNKYLESRVSEESDYAELETRHNELVEAVKKERTARELEDEAIVCSNVLMLQASQRVLSEARDEVDRLIAEGEG